MDSPKDNLSKHYPYDQEELEELKKNLANFDDAAKALAPLFDDDEFVFDEDDGIV